jgi:hypothetical protein
MTSLEYFHCGIIRIKYIFSKKRFKITSPGGTIGCKLAN